MKQDKNKKRRNAEQSTNIDNNPVMTKPMEIISIADSKADPNGSWTGVAVNPYEKPVQDADDL